MNGRCIDCEMCRPYPKGDRYEGQFYCIEISEEHRQPFGYEAALETEECDVFYPKQVTGLQNENTKIKKAFALACRCLADFIVCPATDGYVDCPDCNGKTKECYVSERWKCRQRLFSEIIEDEAVCRVCGCTCNNACAGGCYWVEEDLCSQCVGK